MFTELELIITHNKLCFIQHPTNYQKKLTASLLTSIQQQPHFFLLLLFWLRTGSLVSSIQRKDFFSSLPSSVGRTRHLSLWFSLAKIVVEDCDHGQNFNENYYVDTAQWTQINLFLARFSILYYQVFDYITIKFNYLLI